MRQGANGVHPKLCMSLLRNFASALSVAHDRKWRKPSNGGNVQGLGFDPEISVSTIYSPQYLEAVRSVGANRWTDHNAQTWSVSAERFISTNEWLRNRASRRTRLGATRAWSSSFEMLPVEMSSNLGGRRRSQNEATKSASLVTKMRASRVARGRSKGTAPNACGRYPCS